MVCEVQRKKEKNNQEPLGNAFENQLLNKSDKVKNIFWPSAEQYGAWFSSWPAVNQDNLYLIQWKWQKISASIIRGASWYRSIFFLQKAYFF